MLLTNSLSTGPDGTLRHPPPDLEKFQSELTASLFRQSNDIEMGPNNEFVVSVLRPWIVDGILIGYLKLAIDIEQSLALASSAVNAQIVKVCDFSTSDQSGEAPLKYHALGDLVTKRTGSGCADVRQAATQLQS